MKNTNLKKLATLGVLAACSVVLMLAVRIPFPPAPFLEYDPADIPILIGTFLFGPIWGFGLTVVVSVLQGMTVSAGSGWIGIVMHVAATGCFALLAGFIYRKHHDRKHAYIALVCGVLLQTAIMALMNLWLTPIFMGTPTEAVLQMMIPIIIPFNLLKAGVNAVVTALIYKRIHKFLQRINLFFLLFVELEKVSSES